MARVRIIFEWAVSPNTERHIMFKEIRTICTDEYGDPIVEGIALVSAQSVMRHNDSIVVEGWVKREWSDKEFLAIMQGASHNGTWNCECEACILQFPYDDLSYDFHDADSVTVEMPASEWDSSRHDLRSARFVLVTGQFLVVRGETVRGETYRDLTAVSVTAMSLVGFLTGTSVAYLHRAEHEADRLANLPY